MYCLDNGNNKAAAGYFFQKALSIIEKNLDFADSNFSYAASAVYLSPYFSLQGNLTNALEYVKKTQTYLNRCGPELNNLDVMHEQVIRQRFLQHLFFLSSSVFFPSTDNDTSRYMKIILNLRFLYKQHRCLTEPHVDIFPDEYIYALRNDLINGTNYFVFDMPRIEYMETKFDDMYREAISKTKDEREKQTQTVRQLQFICTHQALKIETCLRLGLHRSDVISLAAYAISEASGSDAFVFSNPMVTATISLAASVNLFNLKREITDRSVCSLKKNYKSMAALCNKYELVKDRHSVIMIYMDRFLRNYEELQLANTRFLPIDFEQRKECKEERNDNTENVKPCEIMNYLELHQK
jgi:hypothetical protein